MTENKTIYLKPKPLTNTNIFYIHNEPELKFASNGNAMLTLSGAVDNTYAIRNDDGSYSKERGGSSDWFNFVCWGWKAEKLAEVPLAGSLVQIEYRPKKTYWEDDEGKKRNRDQFDIVDLCVLDDRPLGHDGEAAWLKPRPIESTQYGFIFNTPEIKQSNSGKDFMTFDVGIDNSYPIKDSEGNFTKERGGQTDWFRCVIWNEYLVEKLAKVDLERKDVGFTFGLGKNVWTDPTSGDKRDAVQFTVTNLWIVNARPDGSGAASDDEI